MIPPYLSGGGGGGGGSFKEEKQFLQKIYTAVMIYCHKNPVLKNDEKKLKVRVIYIYSLKGCLDPDQIYKGCHNILIFFLILFYQKNLLI